MATPEEAISVALGSGMDPSKILAWTNNASTGQLEVIYEGATPVNSENITVLVLDAHAGE